MNCSLDPPPNFNDQALASAGYGGGLGIDAIARQVHISELSRQDPRYDDGQTMRKLKNAICDTMDAPQIWAGIVRKQMLGLGFSVSGFHPSIFGHGRRQLIVVVHWTMSCASVRLSSYSGCSLP